jgi:hypothetical protein
VRVKLRGMPPWEIIVVRSDRWHACPHCSQVVVTSPARDATVEEQIQHYVSVHEYRKPEIKEEETEDGRKVRVAVLQHD